MSKRRILAVMAWFKRVVTEPRSELTRWQAHVRNGIDLGRHGLRQLKEDRAPQMAAALSFRTLFGMLPVLVVGTIIFKAVGGYEQFSRMASEVFTSLGADRFSLGSVGANGAKSQTLSEFLLGFVAEVENINLAAITWVGVLVLVYSAMSLMVTIETNFNNIFRAPQGRPWMQRLMIYWSVLTLGPAAIAASLYAAHRFDGFVVSLESWGPLFRVASLVMSFLVPWLVLTAVYWSVPNTRVALRPVMVGAFVATLILKLGQEFLGAYMENAVSMQQLYGSLGLIPLLMFWVYVMWLVVLFGVEVGAALQGLRGRSLEELTFEAEGGALTDPSVVLSTMRVIAEGFQRAKPSRLEQLRRAVGVPEALLSRMIDRLIAAEFLHRTDADGAVVSLSCPPDRIELGKLMSIGFELADAGGLGGKTPLKEDLRAAQIKIVEGLSLEHLVAGDHESRARE